MSDTSRSKLGPIPPENFDGDAFVNDDVDASYSKETNEEFATLLEELKKKP